VAQRSLFGWETGSTALLSLRRTGIYASLVIGDLVPKRMALANPERAASALAPAMIALSRTALPLVWVLKTSTEAVVRSMGLQKARTATVTEEEVRSLIAAGTQAGIFVPQEREMR
jgi:putative hemolysin